jgi:hypothetical protein
MSSILAPPVQGGRVYEGRTWNWLEATARSHDSYDRVRILVAEIADGWTTGLRAKLAAQGIHVLGVEAFVDGDVPEPPFPGVTGPIGVAVFWLTTGPDASDGEPEVYAFARQGAAGVEPFGVTLDAASTRGAFYVAMNTGDAAASSAESWCIATHWVQRSDRGLLSGEFVANAVQNGLQLRCFERGWVGFGTDLRLGRIGFRMAIRYENGRYAHFEWLLSALGLTPIPAGAPADPPEHRSRVQRGITIPQWAPGPNRDVKGEFALLSSVEQAREEIVRIAEEEEDDWTNADGTKKRESEPGRLPKLKAYYGAVVRRAQKVNDLANKAHNNKKPWSAVFISYVVKQSGVRRADGFQFARNHLTYTVHALANQLNQDPDRPFWLHRIDEVTPERGDILCMNRKVDEDCTDHSFDSLQDRISRNQQTGRHEVTNPGGHSHTDIVVDDPVHDGVSYIETIGGNTGDLSGGAHTVGRKRWKLDADGHVEHEVDQNNQMRTDQCSLIGIIKLVPRDQ